MIANAIFAATILLMAVGLYLMQECRFLIPYRHVLFETYGPALAGFAAALFVNLFAAVYTIGRLVFLKDTGRKLAHLEKQLRTGETVSEELSHWLNH